MFRQGRTGCLDLPALCTPGRPGCLIFAALDASGRPGWLDLAALVAPARPGWIDLIALVATGCSGWLDLAGLVDLGHPGWLDLATQIAPGRPGWPPRLAAGSAVLNSLACPVWSIGLLTKASTLSYSMCLLRSSCNVQTASILHASSLVYFKSTSVKVLH